MDFFDQKPFHVNESGSKNQKTLEWKGKQEVSLLECHGSTRSRWTACTFTSSDFTTRDMDRGASPHSVRFPPAQLMFKGGARVQKQLQEILHKLRSSGLDGDLQWLSVVTGDSGSYKREDILQYLDVVLEPWGPERRWRILICDVYKPHCNDAATRLYVMIWVGGGCTGAPANPDVYLHDILSKDYQDREMRLLLKQMELGVTPIWSRLPVPSREDCICNFIAAWMKPSLHHRAVEGNWKLMVRNDLGGTEDARGGGSDGPDLTRFHDQFSTCQA